MAFVGLRNQYAESGEAQALLEKYGLMPPNVVEAAKSVLPRKVKK
jgi:transketolase C-terminal domain/subunit